MSQQNGSDVSVAAGKQRFADVGQGLASSSV
jgi:hypothetical protein